MLSLLVLSVLMMDLMVTEVVLVLDMGGRWEQGQQSSTTRVDNLKTLGDTFGSRTCHTYSDPLAPKSLCG